MASLYKQKDSEFWYASIYIWDEKKKKRCRKRVSTKTKCEDQARAFVAQLERVAETARAIATQTVTKEYAEKLVLEILMAANVKVTGNLETPSIGECFARYLDIHGKKVKERSLYMYRGYSDSFLEWVPDKDLKLDWFDKSKAEDYYDFLLTQYAPKTAKEKFRYVSRVLETQVGEAISYNPCLKVSLTKHKDELERKAMSLEEVYKIIEYLQKPDSLLRDREWLKVVLLAVSAGRRIEDAVTMKSAAIKDGILTYGQMKTSKDITCPIVVPLWLDLLTVDTEYICPDLQKEFVANKTFKLSSEFTRIVSSAGVEQTVKVLSNTGRGVAQKTFHSLRHTLRTSIVSSGGSDAQADLILGHSESQGKAYTHSEIDAMRAMLERVFIPLEEGGRSLD